MFLLAEFFSIFILVPIVLFLWPPKFMIPILWFFAFLSIYLLYKDPTFDRKRLWGYKALRDGYTTILKPFIIISIILAALIYFLAPGLLFSLVIDHPFIWLALLVAYPLLSVYPQELLYRTLFFQRYKPIFGTLSQTHLIILNGLLFGFVHSIFHNWIAVILTAAGGMLFASMYLHTRSTLYVSVAHALYGILLFTLGLGKYFVGGTLSMLK